jgi:DNA-binding TFAR19-related protein (PDSD5 family)
MLGGVLLQDARTRLNTIAAVKPEKARMVESIILRMVQAGQIRGKIDEKTLVSLLEQVNAESVSRGGAVEAASPTLILAEI